CASFPRLRLAVEADTLRARLEIDIGAATAVPLPGNAQQWLPHTVIVDGQVGTAVLLQGADGELWLQLDPGVHQVLLEGPPAARGAAPRGGADRRLDAARPARQRRRGCQPAAQPARGGCGCRHGAAGQPAAAVCAHRADVALAADLAGGNACRSADAARRGAA